MEADFSFERAVVLKFSPAITRRFVHLVVAFPGKLDAFGSFATMETTCDAAEGELTAELALEHPAWRTPLAGCEVMPLHCPVDNQPMPCGDTRSGLGTKAKPPACYAHAPAASLSERVSPTLKIFARYSHHHEREAGARAENVGSGVENQVLS
jgi:hypothetical protein